MWLPKTAAEVEARVIGGDVSETATLDVKVDLPSPKRSIDLAIDVAAMANDGGVLLVGANEDEHKRPTILAPILLAGVRERIDQIVRSTIMEPPQIEVIALPKVDDPSRGYIIVVVPLSPRAPHQVIKDKDYRFYGRNDAVNVPLNEGEVARLYERRQRWAINREEIIINEIAQAPLLPHNDFGYLYIGIRPVVSDDNILTRAAERFSKVNSNAAINIRDMLFRFLSDSVSDEVFPRHNNFLDIYVGSSWSSVAGGLLMLLNSDPTIQPPAHSPFVRIQVDYNGDGHLFCSQVSRRDQSGSLVLMDSLVASLTTRLCYLLGQVYNAAAYLGPIDVGLAVNGLTGAFSSRLKHGDAMTWTLPRYNRPEYRKSGQFAATTFFSDPKSVAQALTGPLFRDISNSLHDPFAHKS